MHNHIVSHIKRPNLIEDSTLHVVIPVSNYARFHSRYRIARECITALAKTPNVALYVVEIAFGDRHHEVMELCSELGVAHKALRVTNGQELWLKENMINLAVRDMLPRDWRYVAWVDGDVFWPEGSGWALETIHQLQHYPVVQPWKDCLDLGPHGDVLLNGNLQPLVHTSFAYVLQRGVPMQTGPCQPYKYAHSGFAWACTRAFWEAVGGLMEECIVGSGDHHMAWAMIGKVHHSVHGGMTDDFKAMAKRWQDRAFRACKGRMGFVKTHVTHRFHGPKAKRGYRSRWSIFVDNKFEPSNDLGRDPQGLIYVRGKDAMLTEIEAYNRSRHEDSTSEE